MKKITKWVGGIVIVGIACYLGLVGYVYNHDKQRNTVPSEPASSPLNAQVLGILSEKGCDYCHTPSANLPFYASVPGVKQLMEYDMYQGYKAFNLTPLRESLLKPSPWKTASGQPPTLTDLNKLEWVVQHQTMPPTRYTAMHWAGRMSQADRDTLLKWVNEQRQKYYTTPDMAPSLRNEPIQPIPESLPVNAEKVALGFRLYHDPRLSGNDTVACAHCHQLGAGGVDGRKTSLGVDDQVGPINAPTVFNSVFNIAQFWDGRAATLQDQAGGPPLNPIEMASTSWEQIIGKLNQDQAFKQEFLKVYPQGFSGKTITDAIAEFERTLITPNSAFDRYLRGDSSALTAQQQHGYQLFKDNRCATCHAGVAMGGESYEPLGLIKAYPFGEVTSADIGRMNVTQDLRDKLRQKVPTLRNVELTGPYFHRGDVKTLDEAVKQMLRYQVGVTLPQSDVDDIVAFLKSLNGVYTPYPMNTAAAAESLTTAPRETAHP
ncbi:MULTISPECIES: cytochrome-c peroxidase [Edwardsiella]|uniref:Cytochrome c551 peroxidase n=2 Tax=Edwardsiella anguillarum TaxID=1821960 RepID=A0A076LU05_9GAMM|nr:MULTISPECIES: cytochrome-c peroxidase [Edwardsiella]AKM47886.1 cytochrome C peroxidase [Edwardsiella sp. EA181011]GAJ68859.1 cytochrome c peroxidase [Edwardsiella piscicida]AIJ10177.1 Cytochrome c551 peroxidase [Edwardsiella anguillarum ET080813]AKR77748.1 cytochrome-c peroxidase [Edwardsiella sp. LADL05-105]KAB0592145.1 c-type cytochrome [Edwardsiella anguillarum]